MAHGGLHWLFAFIIGKCGEGKTAPKRFWLVAALAVNLLVLGFYKYQGFLAENVNRALGEEFIAELNLALPIGISFFTLQAITYVVDVYRGEVKVQKNPLYLGMYIAMFPQLVAGPIVRYADIEHEIDNRRATLEGFAQGLRLFCVGLGKKVLLANTAGVLADSLLPREAAEIGFIGCFSGVAAYTFQIYFDFSGYSDMDIGLGKMMGFEYPRNFNYPYTSKSATEFWRRWHMSLGGFFRDYVYIPLGGNRVSTPRFVLNTMIVWGLTGIWHGAAWSYLFFGMYHFVLILGGNIIAPPVRAVNARLHIRAESFPYRLLQMLRTTVLVIIGELFFRANGLRAGMQMFRTMVTGFAFPVFDDALFKALGIDKFDLMIVAVTLLIVFVVSVINEKGKSVRALLAQRPAAVRWTVFYALILFIIVFGAYGKGYIPVDPMYANF